MYDFNFLDMYINNDINICSFYEDGKNIQDNKDSIFLRNKGKTSLKIKPQTFMTDIEDVFIKKSSPVSSFLKYLFAKNIFMIYLDVPDIGKSEDGSFYYIHPNFYSYIDILFAIFKIPIIDFFGYGEFYVGHGVGVDIVSYLSRRQNPSFRKSDIYYDIYYMFDLSQSFNYSKNIKFLLGQTTYVNVFKFRNLNIFDNNVTNYIHKIYLSTIYKNIDFDVFVATTMNMDDEFFVKSVFFIIFTIIGDVLILYNIYNRVFSEFINDMGFGFGFGLGYSYN